MPKFKKASEHEAEAVQATPETQVEATPAPAAAVPPDGLAILAEAIAKATASAITATKGPEKKTILTYKGDTPWHKAGEPRVKARRKYYVHSLLIDPDMHSNEEIELLNQVKPGIYCNGFVKVERRLDKGINLSWPIKTPDQKLRLSSVYGINSLASLVKRCIDEATVTREKGLDALDD